MAVFFRNVLNFLSCIISKDIAFVIAPWSFLEHMWVPVSCDLDFHCLFYLQNRQNSANDKKDEASQSPASDRPGRGVH